MNRRDRILILLGVLLLIGVAKAAQEMYRWRVFGEERAAIARLEAELESAAVGVIRTQMEAATLRHAIESADTALETAQQGLGQAGREVSGLTGRGREVAYRRTVVAYNEQVERRNELVERWREILKENHVQVDRYNAVADSIRSLAERMGEPYYPVRTPAEIAAAQGVLKGDR